MADIPQWAKERAVAEIANEPWEIDWTSSVSAIEGNRIGLALARYIAAHEEGPRDPLLDEAEEVVRKWRADDGGPYVNPTFALAAIKRGMELAKVPS